MKHPATRELFAYWNDLRGPRAAPDRSDINPAAIRDILADTFMLDVDLERRFPFRLAGTRVNGLFDDEQKGRSFLDLWRAEERRNISAILLTVADGGCPVVRRQCRHGGWPGGMRGGTAVPAAAPPRPHPLADPRSHEAHDETRLAWSAAAGSDLAAGPADRRC